LVNARTWFGSRMSASAAPGARCPPSMTMRAASASSG
jgi:hypothetical protein